MAVSTLLKSCYMEWTLRLSPPAPSTTATVPAFLFCFIVSALVLAVVQPAFAHHFESLIPQISHPLLAIEKISERISLHMQKQNGNNKSDPFLTRPLLYRHLAETSQEGQVWQTYNAKKS